MALKGLLVLGEDPRNIKIADFAIYKDNPDYLIIDASAGLISSEEFKKKLAWHRINSDTRIDILAHGLRGFEIGNKVDHIISVLQDSFTTKKLLEIIAEHAGNKPIQAHIWSCYGGTAANAVEDLPEGSIVLGHGPEKSPIYIDSAINSIKTTLASTIRNNTHNMSYIAQDLVNNLPSYILQDLNIGIKCRDGIVLRRSLAESIFEISDLSETSKIDPNYYFQAKAIQIQGYIEQLKEENLISSKIQTPHKIEYTEDQLRNYEFNRIIYQFVREDGMGVYFPNLIKDGRLITLEESEGIFLNVYGKALLNPEFQKNLLGLDESTNQLSCLAELIRHQTTRSIVNEASYFIEIAKKHNVLEEYLLREGKHGNSLGIAIEVGEVELVHMFVKTGLDLNYEDSHGKTALMRAITNNQSETVKLLLENGANANQVNREGATPLMEAIKVNKIEIIKLLLENGADINFVDREGESPLSYSLSRYYEEIAMFFIQNGADINFVNKYGYNLLIDSMKRENFTVAKELITRGINIDSNQVNPLTVAIKLMHHDIAILLLENGMDPNFIGSDGKTPLLVAMESKSIAVAKLLVEKGANVNVVDNDGNTPLLEYIRRQHIDIAMTMLDKGAEINIANNEGSTPLIEAMGCRTTDMARVLIERGADVNAVHSNGTTPLFEAIKREHVDMVRLLIEMGADVNSVPQDRGISLLQEAKKTGNIEIYNMLLASGAKPEHQIANNMRDRFKSLAAAAYKRVGYIARIETERSDQVNQPHNYRS